MQTSTITLNEIQLDAQGLKNWSAAGLDCIHHLVVENVDMYSRTSCSMLSSGYDQPLPNAYVTRQLHNIGNETEFKIKSEEGEKAQHRLIHFGTIEYVIRGCLILSSMEYLSRHNKDAKIIPMTLTNKNALSGSALYYRHRPLI
uniref:Uncharacterized protein n=1 Tax=Glossina palpalis gambiensis TaxID=67801 RepID=A0A1B0BVP1_9MUSC